jgi:signal transduction histidine kinase
MSPSASPSKHRFSLRRATIVLSAILSVVALLECVTLHVLTIANERHAERIWHATDARMYGRLTSIHLLLSGRSLALGMVTRDPRREREGAEEMGKALASLGELRRLVDPSRTEAVDKAREEIEQVFAAQLRARSAAGNPESKAETIATAMDGAITSLAGIGVLEETDLRGESQDMATWNRLAQSIAWSVSILVVLGSASVAYGLYAFVVRPTVELSEAMKRFGEGKRGARAAPGRSLELARATTTFNEMAEVISTEHSRMVDFLGAVCKELKDPGGVMRTSLPPFAPGKPHRLDEKAMMRIGNVHRELDRLDKMIDSFLDASRVEWERLDLQQEPRDLRELAKVVVQVYETFSTIHEVALAAPDEPVWVRFDKDRMAQVFNALISNAIQFSPRGGTVDVTLETERRGDVDEAVFSVTDRGVGIPQDAIETLFEPFERTASSRPTRAGAAVNLAVANRIVEAHGGRIEVASRPAAGTTFRVRLKLEPRPEVVPRPAEEDQPHRAVARPAPSH